MIPFSSVLYVKSTFELIRSDFQRQVIVLVVLESRFISRSNQSLHPYPVFIAQYISRCCRIMQTTTTLSIHQRVHPLPSLHHQIYIRVATFCAVIYKLFNSVFLSSFLYPSRHLLTCSVFLRAFPIPLYSRKTTNFCVVDTWTLSALMLRSLKQINGLSHHNLPCLNKQRYAFPAAIYFNV